MKTARVWDEIVSASEAGGLRALRWALPRMSWAMVDAFADGVGKGFHCLVFTRRLVAVRNLRIAFGSSLSFREADRLACAANRNFVRSMFHFLRLPALRPGEFAQRVELIGWERYERAAARGKGVIILTAHLGNWELMGARLVAAGARLAVIARERGNSTVGDIMRAARECAGMIVYDKDGGVRGAAHWLREGGALGVLPDQHASWLGVPLEFFGRTTPMHPIVARLARQTGCAVLPCYCTRDGNGYVARIHPELQLRATEDKDRDLVENTNLMTRVLEEQIRRYPDQWLWVHKRWRDNDEEFVRVRSGELTRAELAERLTRAA